MSASPCGGGRVTESGRPQRVFLHIGLPKTGTTYLQRTLWENKEVLTEAGLLLPGRHRRRHLLASLDVRQDPNLARRAGNVDAPWADLVAEAQAWPGDVLISHEFFGPASPAQVRRAVESLDRAEVHVLITAREMVGLAISRWQEYVRNGGRRPIDKYPADKEYDPADAWGWASNWWSSASRRPRRLSAVTPACRPAPRGSATRTPCTSTSANRPPRSPCGSRPC